MWTKSYLINLRCVHVYDRYLYCCTLFGWLVVAWWKRYIFLSRVSIILRHYFLNLLFHLRSRDRQFEKIRNKIDVLSEEPYPLRRGGATDRANRLMMRDDRDDDARDGPALRSSGTRLVSEVSRVTERAALALGCTSIYHHLSTTYYYSRAVICGEIPMKSQW